MQAEFLRDVAKGMSFLHAQQPPVIHADIKSKNMLLDDRWTLKVGDFGHSMILGAIGDGNRIGTPYFCAPEVLGGEQNTTASDIYSFAVLMWETFARKDVFAEEEEEQVLEGVKAGTLRPPVPSTMPGTMQSLMIRCWDQTPANRPTFDEVTREIQDWLDANPARNVQAHANIHHQRTSQVSLSLSRALLSLFSSFADLLFSSEMSPRHRGLHHDLLCIRAKGGHVHVGPPLQCF